MTPQTQFTPGPWETEIWDARLEHHATIKSSHYSRPGICDGRDSIAAVHNSGGKEQQEANARLIASAPSLYAALKKLLNTPRMTMAETHVAYGEAEEAIRMAEGLDLGSSTSAQQEPKKDCLGRDI